MFQRSCIVTSQTSAVVRGALPPLVARRRARSRRLALVRCSSSRVLCDQGRTRGGLGSGNQPLARRARFKARLRYLCQRRQPWLDRTTVHWLWTRFLPPCFPHSWPSWPRMRRPLYPSGAAGPVAQLISCRRGKFHDEFLHSLHLLIVLTVNSAQWVRAEWVCHVAGQARRQTRSYVCMCG